MTTTRTYSAIIVTLALCCWCTTFGAERIHASGGPLYGTWLYNNYADCWIDTDGEGQVVGVSNGWDYEGAWQDGQYVVVPGWGDLVGEISADNQRIEWYNGTIWTREWTYIPYAGGTWWGWVGGNWTGQESADTDSHGSVISVTNEANDTQFAYQGGYAIYVPGWDYIVGQISWDEQVIYWSNGTAWYR